MLIYSVNAHLNYLKNPIQKKLIKRVIQMMKVLLIKFKDKLLSGTYILLFKHSSCFEKRDAFGEGYLYRLALLLCGYLCQLVDYSLIRHIRAQEVLSRDIVGVVFSELCEELEILGRPDNALLLKKDGYLLNSMLIPFLMSGFDLYANGIKNVHLYSLNKPEVAQKIMENLSDILK